MQRLVLLRTISILAVTVFTACGGSDAPSSAPVESTSNEASPAPTFVRLTVTPVPIDTPTPTIEPTTGPQFTDEQLADPVFPDWLDPELTDERPEDEAIYEGWQEYLTNTRIEFTNENGSPNVVNFCADGVVHWPDFGIDDSVTWGATRTAAMSARQWGKVALTATVLTGDFEGRTFTFFIISREGGKVMQTGWLAATEMNITRSRDCLELARG